MFMFIVHRSCSFHVHRVLWACTIVLGVFSLSISTLKSKAFGQKSFKKTSLDEKLSDTFSGISDNRNFRTNTTLKSKDDTTIYVKDNFDSIININLQ